MRASDADRDAAIQTLRDEFTQGRLSHQTFLHRMDAALQAKYDVDLDVLVADLRPGSEAEPDASPDRRLPRRARTRLAEWRWRVRSWRRSRTAPRQLCLPRDLDGDFVIGREPDCDYTVLDLSVSRRHARLYREDGAWLLADAGSTNGTRLNGWRVNKPVPVRPGDLVSLGAVTMIVSDRPPGLGELGQARAAAG